ncbi:hypothetical protein [Cohnella thermotolerans]|uniref:hypothetical protein n=1 Tax=Cohnella thermotolerans TaxID=329858 RepID=UPI0003FF0882|nr:hypothetical protein [Cohnella thermotolerans]
MEDLNDRYNRLVEKEDRLVAEIETIEAYLDGMLGYTHKHGDRYQMTMIEDILNAIHAVESDRRQHLLNVRFEKALLSCRLQKQI